MKEITENDIESLKAELEKKRKEFDDLNLSSLEEKLEWIKNFFNVYVPKLEEMYLTKEERSLGGYLPNELRIHFYLYFPEHGLNQANYAQELFSESQKRKRFDLNNQIAFHHQD